MFIRNHSNIFCQYAVLVDYNNMNISSKVIISDLCNLKHILVVKEREKAMRDYKNQQNSRTPVLMQRAFKIVFPVFAGLFVNVLMLLVLFLIAGTKITMSQEFKHFMLYYSHLCVVIAFLFQAFIVFPVFCKYHFKSMTEKTIGSIAVFLVAASGSFLFAFIVSTPSDKAPDFVINAVFGFIFTLVYLLTNILVVEKFCINENREEEE